MQGKNFLNLDIGLPVERLKKPFVLDDLIQKAGAHVMAEKAAGHDLPHPVRMLALLVDTHKEAARG